MHELSIACSIVDSISEKVPSINTRVSKVFLQIGKLSGVDKNALNFSFEIAAKDTQLEGATLEIEDLPIITHCEKCDKNIELGNPPIFRCDTCGETTPNIIQGKELDIISVEIEDGKAANS